MYFIIKHTFKNSSPTYFADIKKRDGKQDTTNLFVPELVTHQDRAAKFFDKSEAMAFALLLTCEFYKTEVIPYS